MDKKNIRVLVMDVDGTLTDGKIYMAGTGEMMKAFDIKDGLGIHDILPIYNIIPVIITGRKSEMVKLRCNELGIQHLYQGITDKVGKLSEVLEVLNLDFLNCAYIGDDINDLPCMKKVAITGCPSDAAGEIRKISDFVSDRPGGNGAVREFIEWLCN